MLGRAPDLFYYHHDWDEAAMMAQAWAMTKGGVLYRDIFQIHPILNIAIFVPFFALLPVHVAPHVVKLCNLGLVMAGAFMVRTLGCAWLGDPWSALAAALLFAFYFGASFGWAQSSHGEFYAIVPLLLSLWVLWFSRLRGWRAGALAGALWAVAFLFGQAALIDALVLYASYLVLGKGPLARKLRVTAGVGVGFVPVLGVAALYLVARGALGDAVHSTLVIPVRYIGGGTGWTADAALAAAKYFPWSLVSAAMGVGLLLTGRPRGSTEGRLFTLFLAWSVVVIGALTGAGRFYNHYLVHLIAPLSLTAAFVLSRMPGWIKVGVAVILLCWTGAASYGPLATLRGLEWRPRPVQRADAVAAFLKEVTTEGDRIFLYRVPELAIFYLAERASNNGIYMYIDMVADHLHDRAVEERKRREFVEKPPRAIVVADMKETRFFPSAERFFWPIIEREYEPVAAIQGARVFLRRASDRTDGRGPVGAD